MTEPTPSPSGSDSPGTAPAGPPATVTRFQIEPLAFASQPAVRAAIVQHLAAALAREWRDRR